MPKTEDLAEGALVTRKRKLGQWALVRLHQSESITSTELLTKQAEKGDILDLPQTEQQSKGG